MDSKPIVTYTGDEKLFTSLQSGIIEGLSEEPVEWKRTHMRNPKTVYVTANFEPFHEDRLPKESDKSLLGQAFFHTYWTDCNDVDMYKQSAKDAINLWLTKLKAMKIHDWLIIVIDHTDNKKVNKTKLLPRTTVLDKIKNDFPSQGSQRCISVLDPCRNDARAVESFQLLLQRIRKLILQAYSRQLTQFEEHMRTQRERRNEPGWNFKDFFSLQEELAFVLEMLGLYDEALVQYDELDALFTQFVINSNVGEMPQWLSTYSCSNDTWSGVCLLREKSFQLREVLQRGEACLLDLRNYLFSRQCALLLLLCRPWEVAQRTLPFLHNCLTELRILEISMPVGSVACWVFLSCLEVLQTCEKFSDTSQIKAYSLYTAGLWAYACEKLHELGVLCGLMPDLEASSEQLHLVVSLLAGMGEDPYPDTVVQSPHTQLREALSSKESFLRHYMELAELTMGTYKHNRRIRTARLIGRSLAQLYMKLKEPQKAASFLTDLLKTYREENWENLMVQTQQDLFECYREMKDMPRFLKTCIRLSASLLLALKERQYYFQEVLENCKHLTSDKLLLRFEKIFTVMDTSIQSADTPIISNSDIKITLVIQNNLPEEIICRHIRILLKCEAMQLAGKTKSTSQSHLSPNKSNIASAHSPLSPQQSGALGIPSREDMPPRVNVQPQMFTHSYYQTDGTLTYAVICKNTQQIIRRRDSQIYQKEKDLTEEDENVALNFKASDVKLVPGNNTISITIKIPEPGLYIFHRLYMEWGRIHFILSHLPSPLFFTVVEEAPVVELKSDQGELLAGIGQCFLLTLSSGSHYISSGTSITVKPTRGLKLKRFETDTEWLESLSISLNAMKPFENITLPLYGLASFGVQKNANAIEHRIILQCSWLPCLYHSSLHFVPPFLISHKLHTCGTRKYVQVNANGTTKKEFLFTNTVLEVTDKTDATLKPLNPPQSLVVSAEQAACFLWEITYEDPDQLPDKFSFTTDYELKADEITHTHSFHFDFQLNNYQTLYAVRGRVEPPKGSEFCRAGIMCFMHIGINQIFPSIHTSLMYEVVADQSMWAVCGRTAGVVNIDTTGKHSVTLDVMPLIAGFLPLPAVRLSKYIPAEQHKSSSKDSTPSKDSGSHNAARLEPFDPGQIYSWSRAMQVHVLPAASSSNLEVVS